MLMWFLSWAVVREQHFTSIIYCCYYYLLSLFLFLFFLFFFFFGGGGGGLGCVWGGGAMSFSVDRWDKKSDFFFRVKGVNISPTSTCSKYNPCLYARVFQQMDSQSYSTLQRSHLVITNHTTKHLLICSAAEIKSAVMENLDPYWSPWLIKRGAGRTSGLNII